MSTRATLTIKDDDNTFDIYRHHDGYPQSQHGVIYDLDIAQKLAWELPRFEAADFAAAVVAAMKENPGSVYLTKQAENHGDREFHYEVSSTRDDVLVKVYAAAFWRDWRSKPSLNLVFEGTLQDASEKFCPPDEIPEKSREFLILEEAEQTLLQAQEKITSLCGEKPDNNTKQVQRQIETTVRELTRFRRFLEKDDPWQALRATQLPPNAYFARAALKGHERFQR